MFKKRTMPRTFHDPGEPTTPPTTPPAAPPTPAAPPAASPSAPPAPTTPPALPAEVEAELARLRKIEKDAKDAADAAETAKLDEIGKAKKAAETAANEAIAARRENAALKFNLPDEMASRLVGTTKDELEADAKKMAELLKVPPKPATTGTPAGGEPPPAKGGDELTAKQKELDDAQKKGDRMAVLRISREIGALKAKK